jgi:glycosyltransferase involved in cell wall biosynthesis
VASVWGRDVIWDEAGPEPRRQARIKRLILAQADRVTATSRFLAERTRTLLPVGHNVAVIPFGIDCERFRPSGTGRRAGEPVIGFLKHYTPKYGPRVFLEALDREGLAFRAEMYGTKDPLPYRRLAETLGIQERVFIGGAVPHRDVPDRLRGFDVYVMPSVHDSETFGVAALEASACGVPVVASRVGGVPEVVEHERTGLLVTPSDPAALAAALRRLLLDAGLREAMGEAGRSFVRTRYSWHESVERMEALYFDLLGGAGA